MENQSPVLKASSKSKLNVEKGESDLDYGSEMTNHMLDLQKSSPLKQSREAEVQLMQLDPYHSQTVTRSYKQCFS